jgi:hypothetical protein
MIRSLMPFADLRARHFIQEIRSLSKNMSPDDASRVAGIAFEEPHFGMGLFLYTPNCSRRTSRESRA